MAIHAFISRGPLKKNRCKALWVLSSSCLHTGTSSSPHTILWFHSNPSHHASCLPEGRGQQGTEEGSGVPGEARGRNQKWENGGSAGQEVRAGKIRLQRNQTWLLWKLRSPYVWREWGWSIRFLFHRKSSKHSINMTFKHLLNKMHHHSSLFAAADFMFCSQWCISRKWMLKLRNSLLILTLILGGKDWTTFYAYVPNSL